MFLKVALKAINHLLATDDWAPRRLSTFSGQSLRLELGRFGLSLAIDADGFFAPAGMDHPTPAVTIILPTDAPARLLLNRSSLVSSMQISGSAELAECVGFVFKNLGWDAEHDLAQILGDVAARRIVEGGKQFADWQLEQAEKVAANLAEFFTVEQPSLVRRQEFNRFCVDVAHADELLLQLEARIAKLGIEAPQG